MKKLTKTLCLLMTIFTLLMPFQVINAMDIQQTSTPVIEEEKVYSKATIEDDFADNRILVVMNSKTSRKLTDYSPEFFQN